jgi:DNA-binding FadR family transcriptional regulator
MILGGSLGPGERLPVESDLAQMFGVSRSTVREALRVLSSRGLIITSRGVGGGTSVARPEPASISDLLEAGFGLMTQADGLTVAQLLDAREVLESPAARWAATRRTEEQLQRLHASVLEHSQDLAGAQTFFGNMVFHSTIVEAAQNPILSVVTRPVFSVLRTRFARDAAPPEFFSQITRDHQRIVEAIESQDGELAEAEMRRHLQALRPTYCAIDVRRGNEA